MKPRFISLFRRFSPLCSGWPKNVVTKKDKADHILNYKIHEDIILDAKNISKNNGMRSVAKICLNSFWGKFGKRGNLPQTSIVRTYEDLIKLLYDPEKIVQNWIPASENIMYVSWIYKKESASTSSCTNVAIAVYTTAQVRLKLYEYLEKLGKRVLYYDTDSIIFISSRVKKDEYESPTGSLLGDLTDELEVYRVHIYKLLSRVDQNFTHSAYSQSLAILLKRVK